MKRSWKNSLLGVGMTLACLVGNSQSEASIEAINKAKSLMDMGEAKKAVKTIDKHLETEVSDSYAMTHKGLFLLDMLKKESAKKEFERAQEINPEEALSYYGIGKFHFLNQAYDSAVHYCEMGLLLKASPSDMESLYSLQGKSLMKMDRYKAAEDALYRAARSPEVGYETMTSLAQVLVENNKYDEAAMVLRETIDIFGRSLETLINTGYVCNTIGLYDEALYYLEEAQSKDKDNPFTLANLAVTHLKLGSLDKAYRMADQSLKNDNTNSFAYRVKGECLVAMNENSRACREFRKAIQMGYSVQYGQAEITQLMLNSCSAD